MTQSGFPFSIEDLLASAVEALKAHGDARAIAVLLEGDCQPVWIESDWGIDSWRILIAIPVHFFYAMAEQDRESTADAIKNIMAPFFAATANDALGSIAIIPQVTKARDYWRKEAIRFIKGEGVTNQGRVRSDNIASKQHQGLLFRSKAEVTLFTALTRAGLTVAPLPVFVHISKSYNRLEPDFIVIFKGLTFVVEVDGDTYHNELPAEADKRLIPLTHEGVEVRRIRAADLESDAAADTVVKELIEFMGNRKAAR